MEEKRTILLVDDDKTILASFKRLLATRYAVDTAETGKEALNKYGTRLYNLAIIDIKLPDIEGTDLLAKLKKSYPSTKKIVITGYPSLESAVSSVNLQADAYLVKPVSPEEFLRVVDEKIREQEEEETITEKKVMYWVESRYQKVKDKGRTRAGLGHKPRTG